METGGKLEDFQGFFEGLPIGKKRMPTTFQRLLGVRKWSMVLVHKSPCACGDTNYLLTGMILQVAAKDKDPCFSVWKDCKVQGPWNFQNCWVPFLIIGILYMLNYVEIIPCIFCEKKPYLYHPRSPLVDHLFTLGVQSPSGGDWKPRVNVLLEKTSFL